MPPIDPKSIIRIARSSGEAASAEPLDLGARVRELRGENARGLNDFFLHYALFHFFRNRHAYQE